MGEWYTLVFGSSPKSNCPKNNENGEDVKTDWIHSPICFQGWEQKENYFEIFLFFLQISWNIFARTITTWSRLSLNFCWKQLKTVFEQFWGVCKVVIIALTIGCIVNALIHVWGLSLGNVIEPDCQINFNRDQSTFNQLFNPNLKPNFNLSQWNR